MKVWADATLPGGRKINDWVAKAKPQLEKLYRVLPDVLPISAK